MVTVYTLVETRFLQIHVRAAAIGCHFCLSTNSDWLRTMSSPLLGAILQGCSPQIQSVVLEGCTPIELIRLSVTDRVMRAMSLRELARHKCTVRITRGKIYVNDNGRVSSIEFPPSTLKTYYGEEIDPYDDFEYMRTASMFLQICRTTRISHLNVEDSLLFDMLMNANMDSELQHGIDIFRVDTMELPYADRPMEMMECFLPRKLLLKKNRHGFDYYGSRDFHCAPVHVFAFRGIVEAAVLEIEDDDEDSKQFGTSAARLALPVLQNPEINLREKSRLSYRQVYMLIQQWQAGRRRISAFSGCIAMKLPDFSWFSCRAEGYPKTLDAFCSDVWNTIQDSEERPFPDVIHPSVLAQFNRCEGLHGAVRRDVMAPRSLVVCRADDKTEELVVVVKPLLNEEILALGMFERTADIN